MIEKQENKTPICFGGRKLLKERQTLKNGSAIEGWQHRWHKARHREFFLVGSHETPPARMELRDFQYYSKLHYSKLQRWYRPLEKSLDFLSGWRHFRRVNQVNYSIEVRLDGRPGMNPGLIQESTTLLSAHPAL